MSRSRCPAWELMALADRDRSCQFETRRNCICRSRMSQLYYMRLRRVERINGIYPIFRPDTMYSLIREPNYRRQRHCTIHNAAGRNPS